MTWSCGSHIAFNHSEKWIYSTCQFYPTIASIEIPAKNVKWRLRWIVELEWEMLEVNNAIATRICSGGGVLVYRWVCLVFFFYSTGSVHFQNGSTWFTCVPIIFSTLARLTKTLLYWFYFPARHRRGISSTVTLFGITTCIY